MARRILAVRRRSPDWVFRARVRDNISARLFILSRLRRLVTFGVCNAANVKRSRGIGLRRQMLDLFRLALIHRIDPAAYYAMQLYDRPEGVAAAAHYLGRHETKNGIYNLLIDPRPEIQANAVMMRDKRRFAAHCRRFGLPIVESLAVVDGRNFNLLDTAPGALDRDLFVKPVRSKGAIGATAFTFLGPDAYLAADGVTLTWKDVAARLARLSRRRSMMVLRKLLNHSEIADLADQSAITFRVFTCTDPTGAPVVTHGMLRVLSKLEPDWGIIDEYGAPIDLATGRLGLMCSDLDLAPQSWWQRHPVTGAPVEGRVIAGWPAIAELARSAHRAFPQRNLYGWDIVLTPEGPVLLEGNVKPDTHFLQRVHRQLMGQSPLAPLLRHHLARGEDPYR
jgi:hypothetical protein